MNMTSGRHTEREAYERFYLVVVRINKNKPPMKCTSLALLVPIGNRRRASLLHYTDDSFLQNGRVILRNPQDLLKKKGKKRSTAHCETQTLGYTWPSIEPFTFLLPDKARSLESVRDIPRYKIPHGSSSGQCLSIRGACESSGSSRRAALRSLPATDDRKPCLDGVDSGLERFHSTSTTSLERRLEV